MGMISEKKCIAYIRENVSQEAIMMQLAEECAEVAQQALKLVRIHMKENPTPVTAKEASEKFHQELADFFAALDCISGIDYSYIFSVEQDKLNRWCYRLANTPR